jgi:glucose-1-phosphate thymidylyltransferase
LLINFRSASTIAFRQGWIDAAKLEALAQPLSRNGYGQYLLRLLRERVY